VQLLSEFQTVNMPHGYVLFFDNENNVLIQRKSYFQHFSVQRDCYYTQPICANPGQNTLPGGTLNREIVDGQGTLAASLKQFTEESGVTLKFLNGIHYSDIGCYSDLEDPNSMWCENHFYVHFVRVDSIDKIVAEATRILQLARNLLHDESLSEDHRNQKLRELHSSTGYNDDAAESYMSVHRDGILSLLSDTIPFKVALKNEWKCLVREQELFKEHTRERKMRNILSDPGEGRDWLVAACEWFLNGGLVGPDEVQELDSDDNFMPGSK
jgi:hypothetical protein